MADGRTYISEHDIESDKKTWFHCPSTSDVDIILPTESYPRGGGATLGELYRHNLTYFKWLLFESRADKYKNAMVRIYKNKPYTTKELDTPFDVSESFEKANHDTQVWLLELGIE